MQRFPILEKDKFIYLWDILSKEISLQFSCVSSKMISITKQPVFGFYVR